MALALTHQNMLKNDLGSLKFDVDKLDIAKLKSAPLDLSNLSNVVKDDVVKKIVYHELLKKANAIQTIYTGGSTKKLNIVKIFQVQPASII